jgi:hypothetical protein
MEDSLGANRYREYFSSGTGVCGRRVGNLQLGEKAELKPTGEESPLGPERAELFQEELLLRVAYAYEKLSEWFKVKLALAI